MGWFDGLLGGGGGGGGDYAGLLSGTGSIDYNKLMQQELANADNAKWAALAGALAEAGMPSRLPVPIGSAIGKAAAAFGGGENNSLLKILQIQKLATETQNLKELSELRKKLAADDQPLLDRIIAKGYAPGAGQPNTPSGDGASGEGAPAGGGGVAVGGGGGADPRGKIPVVMAAAEKYGIDPKTALAVARSEGLGTFLGDGGKSGGAFQLYTGGGLGNEFQKETGLNPLDPKNEDATIDYALKRAAENGWGPWNGAKRIGITGFTGIGENRGAVAGAASAPAAPPLPAAFNLPKFSGLLGDRTDAEQPSIQVMPDGGGLLSAGVPSAELRGDPSRVATSLGPPGTYKINSKGQPYSPELETMPPDQKAKIAEAMRSIKERMLAGGGSGGGVSGIPPGDAGGGGTEGVLPGDLGRGIQPGQGPLAIPRPAGLPPMPAATAAPLGGLLAPPQAPAAPPAGPGLLAPPQAPAAVPAAPPAVRPGPSYMPQMPAGNDQELAELMARVARQRVRATLGGITGDPYSAYAHLLENSPAYQRQKALIEQQMKYYGPEANVPLQSDIAGGRAGAETPWKNYQEAYKADLVRQQAEAQARLNDILKQRELNFTAGLDVVPGGATRMIDGVPRTVPTTRRQLAGEADPGLTAPPSLPGQAPAGLPAAQPPAGSLVPGRAAPGGGLPGTAFYPRFETTEQKAAGEARGKTTAEQAGAVDSEAKNALSNRDTLTLVMNDLRNVHQGWGADTAYNFGRVMQVFDPAFKQPVASYENAEKALAEMTGKLVRATDPNPTLQQSERLLKSMPVRLNSEGGNERLYNRMAGFQDEAVNKSLAQRQYALTNKTDPGGTGGFETYWREHASPIAFVFRRMPSDQQAQMVLSLRQTESGKQELEKLKGQLEFIEKNGLTR